MELALGRRVSLGVWQEAFQIFGGRKRPFFFFFGSRLPGLSNFTFMHWRRKWQPTPVFLPGESQGRGILVGCRLWGRTESDTTEVT